MAKIRHISYRAENVDAMVKFFVDALGLTMAQKRKDDSIDLSDGSVNISFLPLASNRSRRPGLDHIGFSAEDDQEQIRRVRATGAVKENTRSPYEEKFKGPEGSPSTSAAGQAPLRKKGISPILEIRGCPGIGLRHASHPLCCASGCDLPRAQSANARARIFEKDLDYEAFSRVIAETARNSVRRLTTTHVRRWHLHRHSVGGGHLYQGTYKSFPKPAPRSRILLSIGSHISSQI